jgi:hypothetical protein
MDCPFTGRPTKSDDGLVVQQGTFDEPRDIFKRGQKLGGRKFFL